MRRPLTIAYVVYILVLLGVLVGVDAATDIEPQAREIGLYLLRGIRTVGLVLLLFFVLPAAIVIEPSIENGEPKWLDIHHRLSAIIFVLFFVIALPLGLEIALYGVVGAVWLAFCTWIFWGLVLLGIVVIYLLASGERFAVSVVSSTGGPAVFKEVTGDVADIDISVSATTDKPAHAPVTVKFDSAIVKGAPGVSGQLNTDMMPLVAIGGQGTVGATASGNSIGGFAQPIHPGVSEMHITITGTCAQGHSRTWTRIIRYQK